MNKQKFIDILNKTFGFCIYVALLAGGLAFFGFLIAIIIGGANGESLAVAINGKYFPLVIRVASIAIGVGLISMYLGNEQALSLAADKKEAEEELQKAKNNAKNDNYTL